LFIGLVVVLCANAAMAQATAQLTGTVKDSSGGVLPGANVTATQTETGFKREAFSDTDGAFSFPGIPVGPYSLQVALQGFRTSIQTGIILQVNSNPCARRPAARHGRRNDHRHRQHADRRDARPGDQPGHGQQAHRQLPLNGRSPADLLALLPAAVRSRRNATSP
jgi:hypothetical protein